MLKNHKTAGFSLLEIMVALVVLSTSMVALIALQGSLNKSALRSQAQEARVSSLLTLIAESLQFDWVVHKKDTVTLSKDDDRIKLEYTTKTLSKGSALQNLKQLKRIDCTATSQGAFTGSDKLIAFVYVKEQKEEKNAA